MKYIAVYAGQCADCGRAIAADLEITNPAGPGQGIIPPPVVRVACTCKRPPREVALTFVDEKIS